LAYSTELGSREQRCASEGTGVNDNARNPYTRAQALRGLHARFTLVPALGLHRANDLPKRDSDAVVNGSAGVDDCDVVRLQLAIGQNKRAAWSYVEAWPDVARVSGFVSFEPDMVDVYLDGRKLALEPGQAVIPHGIDRGLDPDEVRQRSVAADQSGHLPSSRPIAI
jgi:hypothetical protein